MAKKQEVKKAEIKKPVGTMFRKHVLPENVMLTGLIGMMIILALGFFGTAINASWAWAFGLVFGIMIVASFVSMSPVRKVK
jgi:hypothetical protein